MRQLPVILYIALDLRLSKGSNRGPIGSRCRLRKPQKKIRKSIPCRGATALSINVLGGRTPVKIVYAVVSDHPETVKLGAYKLAPESNGVIPQRPVDFVRILKPVLKCPIWRIRIAKRRVVTNGDRRRRPLLRQRINIVKSILCRIVLRAGSILAFHYIASVVGGFSDIDDICIKYMGELEHGVGTRGVEYRAK